MPTPRIRDIFRNLSAAASLTSPETPEYNCFAWAVGVTDEFWEPGRTWPIDTPTAHEVQVVIDAYRTRGFELCQDGSLEQGVEKLAIYADEDGEPTHAARQLTNGRWTSKLGTWEDIEHDLADLEGPHPAYGTVTNFMRRPRT